MSAKTISIIAITALLTIFLMNNTGNVRLWIFGEVELSLIVVLGVVFSLGFLFGLIVRGNRKRSEPEAITPERTDADYDANKSYLDMSEDDYS